MSLLNVYSVIPSITVLNSLTLESHFASLHMHV